MGREPTLNAWIRLQPGQAVRAAGFVLGWRVSEGVGHTAIPCGQTGCCDLNALPHTQGIRVGHGADPRVGVV